MYRKIVDRLPKQLKTTIKNRIYSIRYNSMLTDLKELDTTQSKIFVIGAPEHGNLGDHAIMDAELKFLNDHFSNKVIIEIPYNMIFLKLEELKSIVNIRDIVCITGGGYMGSLWPRSEEFVRIIISNFSNNKVIVFPQTAYYDTTSSAAISYLESSIDIYNSHEDLTLTAREKNTFNLFQEKYTKANNILTPDIGLYLDETNESIKREGVLICLRNDREKVTDSNELVNLVTEQAEKHNLNTAQTDTVLDRPVFKEHRNKYLQLKLDEFRRAQVVVTDRLHGMIFAVITSTPCIALDNKTGKVKGVYDWVKNHDYIVLLENLNDFEEEFERLISLEKPVYDTSEIYDQFMPLVEAFNKNQ